MAKPIVEVTVRTTDQKIRRIPPLFDSDSFYTIIRYDCLPSQKAILLYRKSRKLGTAQKKGK